MSEINIDELEQAAKDATPGPWRWEFNAAHKRLHLVGGRPQYDLTIMDFDRWGMSGAVATLRDTSEDGMNIMHRLCDRPDWIAPFPGRAHHASWCSAVVHPDMRLIATANPSTILALIDRAKKAEAERDALAAKLAELERQEPVAWYADFEGWGREYNGLPELSNGVTGNPLFARPAPAEPVNARLLDVAMGKIPHIHAGLCPDAGSGSRSRDPECPACRAISAAEAQQLQPQAKGD